MQGVSMKPIIGIDPSLRSTGVAVLFPGSGEYRYRLVRTDKHNFASKESRVEFIGRNILSTIKSLLENESPVGVHWGVEDYAFNIRAGRLADLAEASGFTKQILRHFFGSEPVKINPSTLKKFITGTSKVGKNMHLAYAHIKWGILFESDDAADAFAVAKLLDAVFNKKKDDLYKYEYECVLAVKKYNLIEVT
jgi:Holliday junction resolvasome RuvABC endonuclease subunit